MGDERAVEEPGNAELEPEGEEMLTDQVEVEVAVLE